MSESPALRGPALRYPAGRYPALRYPALTDLRTALINALFGNGEEGALYDPSDLSTLFQDAVGTTPVTGADQPVGLRNDLSGNDTHGTQTTDSLRGVYQDFPANPPTAFDYFIDATSGDDGNAGTSAAAAWATLSKIGAIVLAADSRVRVHVAAGTYDTADDYVLRNNTSAGGAPGANAVLEIVFASGCVMDGTAANALAVTNGFEFSGSNVWTAKIYGNGLTAQNYSEGTAASPNGFSNRGSHRLFVHDAHCDNCDDGFSAHESAQMTLFDCSAQESEKSPFIHTDSASVNAYRCTFSQKTGGVTGTFDVTSSMSTADIRCYDCVFIPDTNLALINARNVRFERCQIGTLSVSIRLTTGAGATVDIIDSCVNVYIDGDSTATLTGCYGLFSARVRNGGAITATKSVFAGPATGQTAIVFSNFNPGGASKFTFNDNIFETATAAAFMSVDATNAGYLVAADSEFFNNILSGSAAYDADLIAADTGNTVIVDNVTDDALIGSADSLLMADYAFGAGSPAIGAATDGGDSGIGADDVIERVTVAPANPSGYITFLSTDYLRTAFGNLGADCTVARSLPGFGAEILTGQTISGNYDDNQDNHALVVVDRALTAAEVTDLTRWLDTLAGV